LSVPSLDGNVCALKIGEGFKRDDELGWKPLAEHAVWLCIWHVEKYWHVWVFENVQFRLVAEGFATILCFNHLIMVIGLACLSVEVVCDVLCLIFLQDDFFEENEQLIYT
jgi:hypothetical protein